MSYHRQFYEFLQVDWAKILTYSRNMYYTFFLKARELSWQFLIQVGSKGLGIFFKPNY